MSVNNKKSRSIDGWTYEVGMLSAEKGLDISVVIAKSGIPIAVSFYFSMNDKNDKKSILDVDVEELKPLIDEFKSALNRDELKELVKVFAPISTAKKNDSDAHPIPLGDGYYSTHFSGNILRLYKWLLFCIEVNYSDFLAVWRSLTAGKK